jgi:hypothetical protein
MHYFDAVQYGRSILIFMIEGEARGRTKWPSDQEREPVVLKSSVRVMHVQESITN